MIVFRAGFGFQAQGCCREGSGFTEWVGFSPDWGWVGWMDLAGVMHWDQVGTGTVGETEAGHSRVSGGASQGSQSLESPVL